MYFKFTTCIFGQVVLSNVAFAQTLKPLFDTITADPTFSKIYGIIKSTGGSSNLPGPALEERFNCDLDRRNFTAFLPTNVALSKMDDAFISELQKPPLYELLLAMIRTQIGEGAASPDTIRAGTSMKAVEGFNLTSSTAANGDIVLNQKTEKTVVDVDHFLTASNGFIYPVSGFLDPFEGYFGVDNESQAESPCSDSLRTMAEIVSEEPEFSLLKTSLQAIAPAFLDRLSLTPIDGRAKAFYFAPSNEAFEQLPEGSLGSLLQPSNRGLSELILTFGLAQKTAESASTEIWKSQWGLDITLLSQGDGKLVNNAGVGRCICGRNGCVSATSRLLDPVFQAL